MSGAPESVRIEGADGVTLAAAVEGPAAGWPVVLLHGGGQTRHAWRGIVDALVDRGWLTFAVDLRGHGDSDWASDYTVDAYARDCAALVGQFDRPPVLVGASLGGVISVITEGELRPGGSTALVVADIVPDLNLAGVARVRDFMGAHGEGFSSLEDAATAIADYTGRAPRSSSTAGLLKVLRQRENGRWYWHWDPRVLTNGLGEDEPKEVGRRMGSALGRVTVPTLLVRGLVSDVVTTEGAEDFVLRAPNAERADIGGAGHMVAGDQNDAFTEATLSFLDRRIRPLLALDS